MYKMRVTWSEVFSPDVLFALDTKVRQYDPRWPIVPPKKSGSSSANPVVNPGAVGRNIHINPAIIGRSRPPVAVVSLLIIHPDER